MATKEYVERAVRVGERIGNPDQAAFVLANVGDLLTTLGDWDAALQVIGRAMALRGERHTAAAAGTMVCLAKLTLHKGDWAEAERLLSDALAVTQRTGARESQEDALGILAELEVLTGRPEEAIAHLEDLAAREGVLPVVPVILAWAELDAGHLDEAEAVISAAIPRMTEDGQQRYLPDALRVQGMLPQRWGRSAEAERVLREGLALARELPSPYAEARILEQLGQPDEARAIFQRLGAMKDVERIEQAAVEGSGR